MKTVNKILILLVSLFVCACASNKEMERVTALFDTPLRDPSICVGPDGTYYLTGTTGNNTNGTEDRNSWWYQNEGIRLWKSKDLKEWEPMGLVWSLEEDATWAKEWKTWEYAGVPGRALWAPEIHYMKGTFWLTYSMNYEGCGLLKSVSGKAEGPYVDVQPEGPLCDEIDASLFQDDDGKVYWIYANGMITQMKDDMSGFMEPPHLLTDKNGKALGHEGAFIFKHGKKYILLVAGFTERDGKPSYDCKAAVADHVYGPYGEQYAAIPHGGHNMIFKNAKGKWMSTFFGNEAEAAIVQRPGVLPIKIDKNGIITPLMNTYAESADPAK